MHVITSGAALRVEEAARGRLLGVKPKAEAVRASSAQHDSLIYMSALEGAEKTFNDCMHWLHWNH